MKTFVADSLKRVARWCIKLANRIDGPQITVYNSSWQKIGTGGIAADISLEQVRMAGGPRA